MTPVATPPATAPNQLVTPHGGTLVDRFLTGDAAAALRERAKDLPVVQLDDTQVADLEMLATGAMSPLEGFLEQADYDSVVESCRLADGTVWSLPITLRLDDAPTSDEIAFAGPDGTLLGTMDVREVYTTDRDREAELVYGTTDEAHPGVAMLRAAGEYCVGGPVQLFALTENVYGSHYMTPAQTREALAARGWTTVVGFQTRNPVHRAHEYIIKTAMETVDGLLLHPLVGRTKDGDIPADVRMACYEELLNGYFPSDRVLLGVFPAVMRYAGPREAIFHAMTRKNYGCSHFIVGRDHAGVGSYYGTYDAQDVFNQFTREELGIEIMKFEHSFFCRTCDAMASAKTCPHPSDDHVFLSGTKVREMLGNGEVPPIEFTRPEVAKVLIDAYAGS
jgi:ATP sulfurylase